MKKLKGGNDLIDVNAMDAGDCDPYASTVYSTKQSKQRSSKPTINFKNMMETNNH